MDHGPGVGLGEQPADAPVARRRRRDACQRPPQPPTPEIGGHPASPTQPATMGDDAALRAEEFEVLGSIYGDDCWCDPEENSVRVWIPSRGSRKALIFQVRADVHSLPIGWPHAGRRWRFRLGTPSRSPQHSRGPHSQFLLSSPSFAKYIALVYLSPSYHPDVLRIREVTGAGDAPLPPGKCSPPPPSPQALLPEDYPSASAPVLQLSREGIDEGILSDAALQMAKMFVPGEVVLFTWVEWLREQGLAPAEGEEESDPEKGAGAESGDHMAALGLSDDADAAADGGSLTVQAPWGMVRVTCEEDRRQLALMESVAGRVVHGEPFTERKSTFQAHCCSVSGADEVRAVVELLLLNNRVRNATHNIMAYRIEVPGKPGVFSQDADDDGEDAAGGRLLHLLQVADARGVVVVVSRWFGGVLLGPSRFTLINNAARQLLESEGYINAGGASGGGKKKRGGGK